MTTLDPRRELAGRPEGDAWWAYCVLSREGAGTVAASLEGIEPGTRVEAVSESGLVALVSPVPLAEYGDRRLREHLEDLAWVERTARAHEAVLDDALGRAPIVPLRLCTLYHDRDGVRRLLRDNAAALLRSLAAVDGCAEWGLKLFADPDRVKAAAVDEEPDVAGVAPRAAERPGAAYLQRRQRERALAGRAGQARARCAEAVHERLSEHSRSATVNPPQRPEAHGRGEVMVLNAAYLVANDRAGELRAAVAELAARWGPHGFLLELTGPWPAYNFVSIEPGIAA